MRLLVITARYPIPEQPAAGVFVRRRLDDERLRATIIAPSTLRSPWWRRYAGLQWRGLTARGRFDGVEGHFVLPSGVVALIVARLRRLPLVVVAHGSDVGVIARRHRLLGWLARRVLRGADLVVANSTHLRDQIRALGVDAETIAPGIELASFAVLPRPAGRRVLYLGGADPAKGFTVARGLADTLLGPGLRVVDPAEIPGILAEHDILLMPSVAEAFGIAATEAIAAGRWVVASDVGGLREVVTDGVNGTLVSDGDFAGAIERVPDYDPAAVAATAARFAVEHQRRAMAAAWRSVLEGRGR